jgi:hypothetical protein
MFKCTVCTQVGQHLMAEQMRVQRLRNAGHLSVALNNLLDSACRERPKPPEPAWLAIPLLLRTFTFYSLRSSPGTNVLYCPFRAVTQRKSTFPLFTKRLSIYSAAWRCRIESERRSAQGSLTKKGQENFRHNSDHGARQHKDGGKPPGGGRAKAGRRAQTSAGAQTLNIERYLTN